MVALLTSDPAPSRFDTLSAAAAPRLRTRHLHVLPSPRAGARPEAQPEHADEERSVAIAWLGIALVVALVAVGVLRTAQQTPATSWSEVYGARPVVAAPLEGEKVWLVRPGDTLWSIAAELAPGADRREIVQRLSERNGGAGLLAGQTLVIPPSIANP